MPNVKIRTTLKLLLFFLAFSFQSQAFSSPYSCSIYFDSASLKNRVAHYFSEVGRTRGGRLFFTTPDRFIETKAWGLVVKEPIPEGKRWYQKTYNFIYHILPNKLVDVSSDTIRASLSLLKNRNLPKIPKFKEAYRYILKKPGDYKFAPFQFLDRVFLDKPTQALTQELLYTRKKPSLLVKIPLMILLSMKAYEIYDQKNWDIYDTKIEHQIELSAAQNPQYFIELAQTDYRYDAYKNEIFLPSGQVNKQVLEDVAAHSRAYYEYYSLRPIISAKPLSLEVEKQAFENNPLFAGVKSFTDMDLQPTDSYDVAAESRGPVSPEKQNDIYKLRHLLLYQYDTLDLIVFNPGASKIYEDSNKHDLIIDTLLNDSLIQRLVSEINANRISLPLAKNFAQRYLEQIYMLSVFNILGITYYIDDAHSVPLSRNVIAENFLLDLEAQLNR